jgi:hypothetical protein
MNSKLNGTLQGLVCKLDEAAGTEKMSQVHYYESPMGFRRVDTQCKSEVHILLQALYAAANGVTTSLRTIQRGADTQLGGLNRVCQGKKMRRELVHAPFTQRFANLQFTE